MTDNYKQLAEELYETLKKVRHWGVPNAEIDNVISRYEEATTRGTGRTTALYNKCIAESLGNPGKSVEFIDHYPHNWERAKSHAERLEKIINKLGYDIVVQTKGQAQVYLYNRFGHQSLPIKPEFTEKEFQEYLKCSKDPVYFINKYVKHNSSYRELINFKLYPSQEAIVNLFHYNKLTLVKSSRQSGKSSTGIFYLLHRLVFNENADTAIMSLNLQTSRDLLSRLKYAYNNLPNFLKKGVVEDNKSSFVLEDNTQVTAYRISQSATRGKTFTDIFLDEFAFVDYETAEDFMNVVYPMVYSTTSTKLMISSTKRKNSYFNKLLDDAKTENNKFSYIEMGWNVVPGRDEKWKEEIISYVGEQAFREEYEL